MNLNTSLFTPEWGHEENDWAELHEGRGIQGLKAACWVVGYGCWPWLGKVTPQLRKHGAEWWHSCHREQKG